MSGGGQKKTAAPPQLKNDALMYLPPLTVHLLNSYYDNSNTSNRMLASYLQHYVANPILAHAETQDDLIPRDTTPRRSSERERSRSVGELCYDGYGVTADGTPYERARVPRRCAAGCRATKSAQLCSLAATLLPRRHLALLPPRSSRHAPLPP